MAIGSFELDKLVTVHVPLLVTFRHGSAKRQKWVGCGIAKKTKRAVDNERELWRQQKESDCNCVSKLHSFSLFFDLLGVLTHSKEHAPVLVRCKSQRNENLSDGRRWMDANDSSSSSPVSMFADHSCGQDSKHPVSLSM
jgi:hypothetical protein